VGTRTTSSASVASNKRPSAGVRLAWGEMTWKSRETSRAGRPATSGQLPVPLSSSVQVTGSPTAAVAGTTLELSRNWPTAPLKPAGAGRGSGRTLTAGWFEVTDSCSTRGCWNRPKPIVPVATFTSWLAAWMVTVPGALA